MKTMKLNSGTITINDFSNYTIYTYTSPEAGGIVNSQIIETKKHIILIDTQYVLPFAGELKAFIESLGKPIERIIISHSHPDHWFGNELFKDEKIYALKEVNSVLAQAGDAIIASYQHLNASESLVPTTKTLPKFTLDEGIFTVDDVVFCALKFTDAEDTVVTGIEIPEDNVLIAQDIVYDFTHAFTAQAPDIQKNWIALLEEIKAKNYSLVLGGHGIPSEGDILTPAISYLHDAAASIQKALCESTDKESKAKLYTNLMLDKYPKFSGQILIGLSANYLFN